MQVNQGEEGRGGGGGPIPRYHLTHTEEGKRVNYSYCPRIKRLGALCTTI